MFNQLKRQWIFHVKNNILSYLLIVFIFTTGIMAGTFTVISLSPQQKVNVSILLREFFGSHQRISINRWAIFKESFWKHFLASFLIWVSGLFVWGSPLILIILGFRGFSFGFTIGFMVEHYRFGGVLFSLVCILPQSIIYVASYIAMGIIAILFSLMGFDKKRTPYVSGGRRSRAGEYTRRIVMAFLAILAGILIETFVVPFLFPMFVWLFR